MMAEMVHDTRDMPYSYKNESTIIPAVTGDFCPACGETVLDITESERVSKSMLKFNILAKGSFSFRFNQFLNDVRIDELTLEEITDEVEEVRQKRYKDIVSKDSKNEASETYIELSAINDNSSDFLSEGELNYYLNLKKL